MRKLLLVLGFAVAVVGCSVRAPMYPGVHPVATALPNTNLGNLSSFCQDAPVVTVPGTYPFFEGFGTLTGTTFSLDSQEIAYIPVVSASPQPSESPSPASSPYDVWSGTVAYSGTPHDATLCFIAAAYVNRMDFNETDNAEILSVPQYQKNSITYTGNSTDDTIDNMVLTLSDTSVSSGTFALAGGGHATITVTSHGVYSDAVFRRMIADARSRHRLLP